MGLLLFKWTIVFSLRGESVLLPVGLKSGSFEGMIKVVRANDLLLFLVFLSTQNLHRPVETLYDITSITMVVLGLGQGLFKFFLNFANAQEVTRRHSNSIGRLNESALALGLLKGSHGPIHILFVLSCDILNIAWNVLVLVLGALDLVRLLLRDHARRGTHGHRLGRTCRLGVHH